MRRDETTQDLDRLTSALHRIADDLVEAAAITGEARSVRSARERSAIRAAGAVLTASDRLMAAVVRLLGQTTHRGVIAEEGVTTSTWLRIFAARTLGDEKMLTAAVERLVDMPAVSAWFGDGTLSWPAVRGIVIATRNLTSEQRGWLDGALAEDRERICRLDSDQIVAVVDRLAEQARPDLHADREQRQFHGQRFSVHPRFDGSSHVSGEFDAEATATLLAGLGTMAGDHEAERKDADRDRVVDDDRDGQGGMGWRAERGRSNADRLIAIIAGHLAGGRGGRARPSLIVITDAATLRRDVRGDGGAGVTPDQWSSTAQMLWNTHRPPVELTPSAVQRLACDASMRHVLVDGPHVLGATAAHPAVSATMRAALIARDGGCRFPGCHAPVDQCENHHVIPISSGGATTLANLALICANHHHAIHDCGWMNMLDADGAMTFVRRGVTIASQPRSSQRITSVEPPPPGRPARRRSPTPHIGSTAPARTESDSRQASSESRPHSPDRQCEPAALPF